jgi:hypothetical protein
MSSVKQNLLLLSEASGPEIVGILPGQKTMKEEIRNLI